MLLVFATRLALPGEAAGASLVGRPLEKAMWGPSAIDGASQFPVYKDLGVTIYQIQLRWESVAPNRPADPTNPADPAYRFPRSLDRVIEEATSYGIKVLVMIQGAPTWSNGGNHWATPPEDAADFGAFVTAAARRYPQVRHWMIWGEPLRNVNWPPFDQFETNQGRLRVAEAYAGLLDSAYGALKAESKQNIVIGGNSFTTAREPVYWAPLTVYEFMRKLRLPNGKPPRMDAWGHNPFTGRIPKLSDPPGQSPGDYSDLDRLLKKVKRYVGKPLRKPKLPVFISEFCVMSGPNDLLPHVTVEQQAVWLKQAAKIARAKKRIMNLGWWTLRDSRPEEGSDKANRCGLLDAEGQPKPSYEVFKNAPRRRR